MTPTIAIIGAGFGMYCLLPAFCNTENCHVVSISGKNSQRMSSYCKKYNVKHYHDWKEMLQKEQPDAIAIAVIPKYQFEIAKYALEHKIAVFAEKPLSIDYEKCLELSHLAKKHHLPNMVDFEFPEIPEWKKTKKILEDNVIGKIFDIEINWTFLSHDLKNHINSWKTDVSKGGGALSFFASHVFNYVEYFVGKIETIDCSLGYSELSINKGETEIEMNLKFENGCKGKINIDVSNSNNSKHTIVFYGSTGQLQLQNNANNVVDNFELILNSQKNEIIESKDAANIQNSELDPRVKIVSLLARKFIHWCNSGIAQKPDFQNGMRVQELIDLARTSNSNVKYNN